MRGEGNHKIPGSFAPENMEKTGAERVKYSLACQHEDAISIKFVSYAQKCPTVLCTFAVALRKESVDRNDSVQIADHCDTLSLSARRAWIEICIPLRDARPIGVALRKESVDRNRPPVGFQPMIGGSLSARRAWIEMANFCRNRFCPTVALRKESVDRNRVCITITTTCIAVALRKESVDRNCDHRNDVSD